MGVFACLPVKKKRIVDVFACLFRKKKPSMEVCLDLHQIAVIGNLERLRHHIETGMPVDIRDNLGCTPMHWAAICNRYDMAELLISNECELDPKDPKGYTPVMLAAIMEHKGVVDLLLRCGAKLTCLDNEKRTLLHHVSSNGWADIVQLIIDSGEADVNAPDDELTVPLMLAASRGREDIADLLIRAGADVNRRDAWGQTALHFAADSGQTKVVQLLLGEKGLDLNPQDTGGETPLHRACFKEGRQSCREVMTQLLVAGADTNIKNKDGETVLSKCMQKHHIEEIKLFVQHSAAVKDFEIISKNPVLRENVLKNVDLCTQLVVNKFNCQTLPVLYRNPYCVEMLPSIDNFKLNPSEKDEIKKFVRSDIEQNSYCILVRVCPTSLSALCVQYLAAYITNRK